MSGDMPENIEHLHPRHLRNRWDSFYNLLSRPLHKPFTPVKAGTSNMKRADQYKGYRDPYAMPRCQQLKAMRLAMGMTRREFDRMRTLAGQAG